MDCIFESERLCFRLWNENDKKIFGDMNADPAVMKYFPKVLNEEESGRFYEIIRDGLNKNKYGLWAVELKTGGRFIGFIGFNNTTFKSDFTPCIEIGWRLKKEFWGRGYASEGGKAALEYGINKLGFEEVYSFTSKINGRSEKVMRRIGMIKIGFFQHPNIPEGNKLREHVLYRLTKNEFTVHKTSL